MATHWGTPAAVKTWQSVFNSSYTKSIGIKPRTACGVHTHFHYNPEKITCKRCKSTKAHKKALLDFNLLFDSDMSQWVKQYAR